MPLKARTPSDVVPRTLPEAVSATGASSAPASLAPIGARARAASDVRITVRRFGMAVPPIGPGNSRPDRVTLQGLLWQAELPSPGGHRHDPLPQAGLCRAHGHRPRALRRLLS